MSVLGDRDPVVRSFEVIDKVLVDLGGESAANFARVVALVAPLLGVSFAPDVSLKVGTEVRPVGLRVLSDGVTGVVHLHKNT